MLLVDHLSLTDIYNAATGPLTPDALQGAVIALVAPGLPDNRNDSAVANLYATLSAGDVVDAANPETGLLQRELSGSATGREVHIVRFGDASTPVEQLRLRALLGSLRAGAADGPRAPGILLIGIVPVNSGGELVQDTPVVAGRSVGHVKWDSLTPIVWLSCGGGGSDPAMQPTLTSDTTQTTGLIALRDVAPTILDAEGLAIPGSMSGHPARLVLLGPGAIPPRDERLLRMDELTRANAVTLHWFGWVFGLGGGAVILAAIWVVVRQRHSPAPVLRFLVRSLLAVPLALLIAPFLLTGSPALYLLEISIVACAFASLTSLRSLLWITSAVLVIDALLGTPLVSRALISGYWLSGIRFYGIGNEYMGLMIGAALIAPNVPGYSSGARLTNQSKQAAESSGLGRTNSLPSTSAPTRAGVIGMGLWFLLVLFVLAYPQFGAKAGGAVTAMAAFLPCCWATARQRKASVLVWAAAVILGFAAIFAFSAIAHHLGGRATHIQAATSALSHGRLGYIVDLAIRKTKMAVKIALAPAAAAGIIGMAVVYVLWRRSGLRSRVDDFLAARRDGNALRFALLSGLWGMLAAALFNDSGVVAALLLGGMLAFVLLHEMLSQLCVFSPLMSETSESESPSATNLSSAPTHS